MEVPLYVPVFDDIGELEALLRSCEGKSISEIIVLDIGPKTDTHRDTCRDADAESDIPVQLCDLGTNVSVCAARNRANEMADSEIYMMADSDAKLHMDVEFMVEFIADAENIGVVSSPKLEPGRVSYPGGNYSINDNVLHREVTGRPSIVTHSQHSFFEFDFTPSVGAIYRRDCVENYSWDEDYTIGWEHEDFYVGHWMHDTQWQFATTFEPVVQHNISSREALDKKAEQRGKEEYAYFLKKWGLDDVRIVDPWMSSDYEPRDDLERALNHYRRGGVEQLMKRGLQKLL
jgi:hypothetical protein